MTDMKSDLRLKRGRVIIAASAAFFAPALRAIAQQTGLKANVTTSPSDSMSLPVYAKAAGFFSSNGLDVELQLIPNGGAIIAAVASGAADVGGTNVTSLALAVAKGAPVKLVAPGGVYDGSEPLFGVIVAKNSPIKSIRELEGKSLAVQALKSIGDYASRLAVEKAGGDANAVQSIELPFSEMGAAVSSGRIAAAAIAEPYFSQVKSTIRVIAEPYAAVGKQFYISGFISSNATIAAHPELIAKIAAALRSTASWANKNQAKSGEILSTVAKLDPAVVATMGRTKFSETLTPALVQPNIDLLLHYKQIEPSVTAQSLIYQPGKA